MYLLVFLLTFLLSASQSLSLKIDNEDQWMGIYSGRDKVGYSHVTFKPKNENLEVNEETRLKMNILGSNQEVEIKSAYLLNKYLIQSFEFSMNAGKVNLHAEGRREGKELKIEISSVSGRVNTTLTITKEPIAPPILFKWLSDQKPSVGKKYEVALFDPALILTGKDAKGLNATLSIEDEEQITIPLGNFKTYRVKMEFMNSQSTYWITKEGEMIKEASPLGLVSLREPKEKALTEPLKDLDIVQKTAISSNAKLDNPRSIRLLRVKIDGIESPNELDIQGNGQSMENGIVEIRQSDLSKVIPYDIPYSGEAYKSYTESTSLVQSDSPKIVEESVEILNGEKNSLSAARKINDWVYRNVKKAPTVSLPNALDVLETKRGDCNEHAALFAALSRAAGIPTKIVFGVIYVEGKFYYHAWNEVFVGGWIPIDTTFGQLPADASHIKFVEGDLDRGSEIIKLVGKIKIEILEAM